MSCARSTPQSGSVRRRIAMPQGAYVSGIESNGCDVFTAAAGAAVSCGRSAALRGGRLSAGEEEFNREKGSRGGERIFNIQGGKAGRFKDSFERLFGCVGACEACCDVLRRLAAERTAQCGVGRERCDLPFLRACPAPELLDDAHCVVMLTP